MNALPELRAQGVERVKVSADGSVEIELSDTAPPSTSPQRPPTDPRQLDLEMGLRDAMSSGLPESQNSANLSKSDPQQAGGESTDADTDKRSPEQIRDDELDFGQR